MAKYYRVNLKDKMGNIIYPNINNVTYFSSNGNMHFGHKQNAIFGVESDGTKYVMIGHNGSNLWIGASATADTHHTGGTFISAGDKENINVSKLVNNTRTNYVILDEQNCGNYALKLSGGVLTGHMYLNGVSSSTTSSTANIVFGNKTTQYVVLRANTSNSLVIGTSMTDNTNSIVFAGQEATFRPANHNQVSLGGSGYRWSNTYSVKGNFSSTIESSVNTQSHINGAKGTNIVINATNTSNGGYVILARTKSDNGVFTLGRWGDSFHLFYIAQSLIDENSNNYTKNLELLNEAGNTSFPGHLTSEYMLTKTAPGLPSGTDGRAYWESLKGGTYWYGNTGSPANMPAEWGWVVKTGFSTGGDFSVMFYTQSSGAIYRKSGNANSVTGWVRVDGMRMNSYSTANTTDTWIPVLSGGNFHHTLRKFATSATHTDYNHNQDYLPTMSFLSYWNGGYNPAGNSNLLYCSRGTMVGTQDNSARFLRAGAKSTWDSNYSSYSNGTIMFCW